MTRAYSYRRWYIRQLARRVAKLGVLHVGFSPAGTLAGVAVPRGIGLL